MSLRTSPADRRGEEVEPTQTLDVAGEAELEKEQMLWTKKKKTLSMSL